VKIDLGGRMAAHTTNAAESRRPWRENDVEFARRLWSQLNTDAQRFLAILIQVPGNEFAAAEIGERLSPPRPANRVQTLLGQAGTFCKKQGLQQIWRFRYPTPGGPARYSMDTVLAELLQCALRLPPPPVPDDLFTGDLFNTKEVDERGEQRRLRKILLDGRETATCVLCGREFPATFLAAARIKRRSSCYDDEMRDLANVAMLACTFGCDPLFERGYLFVGENGIIGIREESNESIGTYLQDLDGRICRAFTSRRAAYFRWHHENVFVAGQDHRSCQ
jgi:hypothetical protein